MQINSSRFLFITFSIAIFLFIGVSVYEKNLMKLPVFGDDRYSEQTFHFINQNRKAIGNGEWKDKILLVNFFFTTCPTICPVITRNLKVVKNGFQNNPGVLINSLSVDPARDSSTKLKSYMRKFSIDDNGWNFLTGDKGEIYMLARSLRLTAVETGENSGDFIHSDQVVLIDPEKRIRGYYNATDKSEMKRLTRDIRRLMNE